MKNEKVHLSKLTLLALLFATISCQTDAPNQMTEISLKRNYSLSSASQCDSQEEEIDYTVFKMYSDGKRIGDVMPFFDESNSKFLIYNLKDIWDDPTHKRHPWYAFETNDFYSYSEPPNEIVSCSSNGCDQDYALGTGSVIKKDGIYYAFYTGHNPNYPSECVSKKEGVMLATSSNSTAGFTKSNSFETIYPPINQNFDEQNNFRDPFVFEDDGKYHMLISARKRVNGTFRGVIAHYKSTDLIAWDYNGIIYDGGSINYFMMECPEIFKEGDYYYLIFSDINTRNVYYRKSSSLEGPWEYPNGPDRFDGNGIYGAKTASDGIDRYIFGWTAVNSEHSDDGNPIWGGNLIVHKLYQKADGDLAVCIPHTIKNHLEEIDLTINKQSQWGTVEKLDANNESYTLISQEDADIANVLYDPISAEIYKINATVSYSESSKDFGFFVGACDGFDDVISLRFVPNTNCFRLDKEKRTMITENTIPVTDVPISLDPNTEYDVQIIVENSIVTVYIDNHKTLSCRIYRATNKTWGIFVDNSTATFKNIEVTSKNVEVATSIH
ncbi:glycoside hydrolase family 32 protein [Marinilabilia rubra]|uniref:beta-fructofuranosidase n=1 Tax=Marinilabilia rubra TaxID=2162893 RepID=A0A2U2B9U6_9BACT|nr:glycoside hydrolase family 32 protein [Marinilabilia rubra]PWD99813.1 hypothetical protein DDZ16_07920 [Marinilabilia rubra]